MADTPKQREELKDGWSMPVEYIGHEDAVLTPAEREKNKLAKEDLARRREEGVKSRTSKIQQQTGGNIEDFLGDIGVL